MKKIVTILSVSLFAVALASSASAAPTWDITGTWAMDFVLGSGHYLHTMAVTSFDQTTGDFSGTGFYNPLPLLYTWNVAGNISGGTITFDIVYTGANPGYTVHGTGVIAPNGLSMSGDATGPGQTFTWTATGAAIKIDEDGDGVPYTIDKCNGTKPDVLGTVPSVELGVNRHVWYGGEYENNFTTLVPSGKTKTVTTSQFDLADTYGCSCKQILDSMSGTTGFDFGGHYKYGCSKSVIEDWIAGEYYLETVTVPANNEDGVESSMTLALGENYILRAYGTADACSSGCGYSIIFDAEYSTSDGGLNWVDGVASPYDSYGSNLLDLQVNGSFVDWDTDTTYNPDHTYWYELAGTGSPLSLMVYDVYYSNNPGSLSVDIFADLW